MQRWTRGIGSDENLQKLALALSAFGAPPKVVAAARETKPTEVVFLGAPPVRVDILRAADGIETEGVLIVNKRAAGRPQDLADVALLERVRDHGSA